MSTSPRSGRHDPAGAARCPRATRGGAEAGSRRRGRRAAAAARRRSVRAVRSGGDAARARRPARSQVSLRVLLVLAQPAGDGAPGERDEDCQHGEDGQRRRVQPRREQRPAAGRGLLGVGLDEVEHRGGEEGGQPQARRKLEPDARRRPAASRPRRAALARRARRRARGRSATRGAPAGAPPRPSPPRAGTGSSRRPSSSACATWLPTSSRCVRLRPASSATSASRANASAERETLVPAGTLHVGSVPRTPAQFKRDRCNGCTGPAQPSSVSVQRGRERAGRSREQDPLPAAEAELAVGERDLLAARAEQHARGAARAPRSSEGTSRSAAPRGRRRSPIRARARGRARSRRAA